MNKIVVFCVVEIFLLLQIRCNWFFSNLKVSLIGNQVKKTVRQDNVDSLIFNWPGKMRFKLN